MRYIKFFIIGIVSFFLLMTAIGLLMPSTVTVGRSAIIKAPVDTVRFYTNNPANWRQWINGADTSYYKQLSASTLQKGSKILLGSYTVTVLENDADTIFTLWQGQTTKKQLSKLDISYDDSLKSTIVNWAFQQHLSWLPWDRLGAMLYDKVYGPSMEVSLNKLKQICEK